MVTYYSSQTLHFQVPYSITGWLDKNKDPLNETVVGILSESKEPLVSVLFEKPKEEPGGGKKKGKSSAFQTISSVHRVGLYTEYIY